MKNLSRFKVIQNTLVYGDYKISLTSHPKFVVCYQGITIFSCDEKDTLEDVNEVIFELEKDDQDFKDRKSFQLCLNKIMEMNKWKI